MNNSLGQHVVIDHHLDRGSRTVLTVYSKDTKSGYIVRKWKRVKVHRVGSVDSRPNSKQLWEVE